MTLYIGNLLVLVICNIIVNARDICQLENRLSKHFNIVSLSTGISKINRLENGTGQDFYVLSHSIRVNIRDLYARKWNWPWGLKIFSLNIIINFKDHIGWKIGLSRLKILVTITKVLEGEKNAKPMLVFHETR